MLMMMVERIGSLLHDVLHMQICVAGPSFPEQAAGPTFAPTTSNFADLTEICPLTLSVIKREEAKARKVSPALQCRRLLRCSGGLRSLLRRPRYLYLKTVRIEESLA